MLKKIAILANGGDVAGFNAVIRGIVKQQKIMEYKRLMAL